MFSSLNYLSQSQWQPVKTITLNNCTGNTQTITWDGSLNNTVNSQSALSHDNWTEQYNELLEANNNNPMGITVPAPTIAEPWTYTYDITVTQTDTETYTFPDSQTPVTWSQSDNAHLRSDYLTINRAKDDQGNYIYHAEFVDATYPEEDPDELGDDEDYISFKKHLVKFYNLKDYLNNNATEININVYDIDFNKLEISNVNFLCEHNNILCEDGCNANFFGIDHELEVTADCINDSVPFIFSNFSVDNHKNKYRNHIGKNSLSINGYDLMKYPANIWIYIEDNEIRNAVKNSIPIVQQYFLSIDCIINYNSNLDDYYNSNIYAPLKYKNVNLNTISVDLTTVNNSDIISFSYRPLSYKGYDNNLHLTYDGSYCDNLKQKEKGHIIITLGKIDSISGLGNNIIGSCISKRGSFPGTLGNPTVICLCYDEETGINTIKQNLNIYMIANIITHELTHAMHPYGHCSYGDCIFRSPIQDIQQTKYDNTRIPWLHTEKDSIRKRFGK